MVDIKGYENKYAITEDGRVYSIRYKRYLKPVKCGKYHQVALSSDGVYHMFYIHRLVAEAYIPNPNNELEVDHIDGNTHNNCVDNLEWVSREENMKRFWKKGKNLGPKK